MGYTGLASFPESTEVVYNAALMFRDRPAEEIGDTFVRCVVVVPPSFSFCSLEKLLIRTDKQLDRVAEMAEGRVVPHQWGLIREDAETYRSFKHWFGRGYYLTAEVSRIEPVAQTPEVEAAISRTAYSVFIASRL